VITGVPTKLGFLMVEGAGVNLAAMVGIGFLFGAVLGMGLPPAPVYILVAIVLAPPFMQAGVNQWVVHFFAFFVAVFGELTPPTSITAAITSKIANASFYTTLWRSVIICMSLFTLMVGVFVHPELVKQPGLEQLAAGYLILVSTVGLTFSVQARFAEAVLPNRLIRLVLAALSLYILLVNDMTSTIVSFLVLAIIGYWLVFRRRSQEGEPQVVELDSSPLSPAAAGPAGALGRMD